MGFQVRVQKHHTDHQSEKFLVPFLAWNFKEVLDCLETLENNSWWKGNVTVASVAYVEYLSIENISVFKSFNP